MFDNVKAQNWNVFYDLRQETSIPAAPISLHQQKLYFTPANERLYDTPKTCFVHGCPLSSFMTVNIAG